MPVLRGYKKDPEYVRIQNLNGYDRISQYYFHPGDYNTDNDSDGDDDNTSNEGTINN